MEINNVPAPEQVSQPVRNNDKLIVVLAVFFVLICGTIVGFLAYQNLQFKKGQTETSSLLTTANPTTIEEEESITPLSEVNLQRILEQSCDTESEIDAGLLPFSFDSSIYSKYDVDNLVPCVFDTQGADARANGYVRLSKSTGEITSWENETITLKIGTKDSVDVWMQESDFAEFDQIKPDFESQGVKVDINVRQPGPYGLSSLGVWLEVRGFKKDKDFQIIAKDFRIIKVNGDILTLFAKYQNQTASDEDVAKGSPKYVVNTRYQEFLNEFTQKYFSQYPDIDPVYKNMINSVVEDANGVIVN